ncbi:hypothetical protein JCM11641_003301 [Rhodosporidiobolus odoratus]
MQVLLPGDLLPSSSTTTTTSSKASTLHWGPGLSAGSALNKGKGKGKQAEQVTATRGGLLGRVQQGDKDRSWIEASMKRYTPNPPEPVLGLIVARHAEGYRVDIGASQGASLDALAFEGATKRNKPNLKIGTLIYAHLLSTPPFSEPELSCVDPTTQKSSGFGELKGGMLIRGVELGRCRALLSPKNPLLSRLGATFPFEVAVGMNGRVWVKASSESSSDGQGGQGGEEEEQERLLEVIREIEGKR